MNQVYSHDMVRKRALAGALVVITVLALATYGIAFAVAQPTGTYVEPAKPQPSLASTPPVFSMVMKPYDPGDTFVGLAAWQKAFTLEATTGGSSYGYDSCAMEIKFVPLNYEIKQDGYFILRFRLATRVEVATGENGYIQYGEPAYRYTSPIWNPPGVIDYVRIQGVLTPVMGDGTTGQYAGNNADILKAGSNILSGYYEELDFSQLSSPYYYTWVTTGLHQETDDFSAWAEQLRLHQVTEEQIGHIQGCVDAVTSLLPEVVDNSWFGYLASGVGGAVNYLLETMIPPAPDVDSHAGGIDADRKDYSLHATWDYDTMGTLSCVAQSNNWMEVSYEGYFYDYNGAPLSELTFQLPIEALISAYDPSACGFSCGDYISARLNLVLTKDAWSFQDSSSPLPVNEFIGAGYSDGTARLTWKSDYYSSDDDWVNYYKIVDGVNPPLFVTNTLNGVGGPFQNNRVNIQQGAGVTRTYTIYSIDASGKTSEGRSTTVTTPTERKITITSPASGATIWTLDAQTWSAYVTVYASVSDPGIGVSNVKIGSGRTSGSYTWTTATFNPSTNLYYATFILGSGTYSTKYYLKAQATFNDGFTFYSPEIYIWVARNIHI